MEVSADEPVNAIFRVTLVMSNPHLPTDTRVNQSKSGNSQTIDCTCNFNGQSKLPRA
jgi:hypothetical protein